MNLRTIITFIAFSLATFFSSMAQMPELSLRGGLNLASIGGDHSLDMKIKPGIHIGIFGSLPITDIYKVESGLSYSIKGSRLMENTIQYTFGLHYLELPILARVNIIPNVDLLAGPQISYLLASKIIARTNGQVLGNNTSTEGLGRIDLGVHLGAAYNPYKKVTVGMGFDWGLLPVANEENFRTFNRLFKISLGYNIN